MRGAVMVGLSLALVGCPMEITFEVTGSAGDSTSTSTASPPGSSSSSLPTTSADTSTGEVTTSLPAVTTGESGDSSGTTGGGETSTGIGETSSGTTVEASSSSDGGESSTGERGLWFDCYGCSCDAELFYCQYVFAGLRKQPLRHCPVVEPNSPESGCVAYPRGCGEEPTCECLLGGNDKCMCAEVDRGVFEVICQGP